MNAIVWSGGRGRVSLGETRSRGSLLDSGDGASDDMAVHMHALVNRAGGVPVRDYYFAGGAVVSATQSGGFSTRHLPTFAS
jgi:hypothetical protein